MQRFMIIGRVGTSMELRVTNSNKKVVEFSMADTKKAKDGQDITTWINVVAWENRADTLAKYVSKGDMLYIEGELRNQKYTTKEGIERYKTFILLDNFQLLPNARKEQQEDNDNFKQKYDYGFEQEDLELY